MEGTNMNILEDEAEDICGLCGKSGADKVHHPCYWPTELKPGTKNVHSECEQEECKWAYAEFYREVGDEGIREFLRKIIR